LNDTIENGESTETVSTGVTKRTNTDNTKKACICMHATNILAVLATIGFKLMIQNGMSVASVLISRNLSLITISLVSLRG